MDLGCCPKNLLPMCCECPAFNYTCCFTRPIYWIQAGVLKISFICWAVNVRLSLGWVKPSFARFRLVFTQLDDSSSTTPPFPYVMIIYRVVLFVIGTVDTGLEPLTISASLDTTCSCCVGTCGTCSLLLRHVNHWGTSTLMSPETPIMVFLLPCCVHDQN